MAPVSMMVPSKETDRRSPEVKNSCREHRPLPHLSLANCLDGKMSHLVDPAARIQSHRKHSRFDSNSQWGFDFGRPVVLLLRAAARYGPIAPARRF